MPILLGGLEVGWETYKPSWSYLTDDCMMPNVDPRQLKRMMESMGIRSTEIDAQRVIIEGTDMDIIIDSPQVTAIDAQGSRSFQVAGSIREVEKAKAKADISDDDVSMVAEQSGVKDPDRARKALEETGGDIAAAIIKLREGS
jgi:nascent polypeptide-associated complex subunit alpha